MDGCLVTASLLSICLVGNEHACAVEPLKFSLLIFLPLDVLCRRLSKVTCHIPGRGETH